tara:strand:+ start:253 stop:1212 length:960 start_codon:yes stop_codon:yes gene_type:complete
MKTTKINFICPLCKSNLHLKENSYLCSNDECPHSCKEEAFHIINSKPIFYSNHLDSVMIEKKTSPYVTRGKSFFQPMQKLKTDKTRNFLYGNLLKTKKNLELFVTNLNKLSPNPKVLIIGSGTRGNGTSFLYETKNLEIYGQDIYGSENVDFISDAHYLPLASEQFDGILIQAVLEHVVEPTKVVSEIYRLLKDNGVIYAETPFMQQVHEGAYDFNRYSVLGHRYLFKKFEMLKMGGLGGSEVVLTWAVKYFIWSVFRIRILAKLIGFIFSILLRPFSFLISKSSMHDSSSGTFFLGIKKKGFALSQMELIKLYKGNIS